MLYLIAILLPPLALLLCGKPWQFLLSLILCLTVLGWVPAAIWSLLVVNEHHAEQRSERFLERWENYN